MIYWRMGYPGWRLAAELGMPIKVKIDVIYDSEANVYFAHSHDIGLALEAQSLDALMTEIHLAMPELVDLTHSTTVHPTADIRLHDRLVAA